MELIFERKFIFDAEREFGRTPTAGKRACTAGHPLDRHEYANYLPRGPSSIRRRNSARLRETCYFNGFPVAAGNSFPLLYAVQSPQRAQHLAVGRDVGHRFTVVHKARLALFVDEHLGRHAP